MPVIMGTAGHIDHGKTTLIRALTGKDCDRLAEEKRRGITIELGFAELALPGQSSLSVVDVPGHEKFVRTMVAGASGVDFVLLVIAADEGVMPQTREHLEICSLLAIRNGVVALTKIDAVDEDMLALATEDVSSFLQGTVLENAPIIPVSAQTGQGLDRLVKMLAQTEAALSPARSLDLFRLPIDRVFTMRGHGTVVTGTMIAGSVSIGDTVEICPGGLTSKVRGLQSHGATVQTALAGRRTAINLADLAVEDVHKGSVVSHPQTLFPSTRWAAEISCLPSSPRALRHRTEAHFHHGSREMQAKLYLADRDKLQPGESCLCELRFSEPAVGVFGDRFVLRSFSPLRTVAGGVVLNPLGVDMRRRSKGFAERCAALRTLAASAGREATEAAAAFEDRVYAQLLCTDGTSRGMSFSWLRILTNADSKVLHKALTALSSRQRAFCFDREQRLYLTDVYCAELLDSCLTSVAEYHKRQSAMQGIKRSELISGWGKKLAPKMAYFVIERLLKEGKLVAEAEFIRLSTHTARFSKEAAPVSSAILTAHKNAGNAPPNLHELFSSLGISQKEAAPVMAALRASGQLVRVADNMWYAAESLKELENSVRAWFAEHETLDLAGLRSMTGLSRKYLVALLEYFDAQKLTMRLGDVRVLRKTN